MIVHIWLKSGNVIMLAGKIRVHKEYHGTFFFLYGGPRSSDHSIYLSNADIARVEFK